MSELKGIVIDNGSGFLKAGFVGDQEYQCAFPNAIHTYHQRKNSNIAQWVGDEVPGNLKANTQRFEYRPIVDRGIVTHWEDMETIWKFTFQNMLRVNPEEHPVLLTEPPLNPKASRERAAKILFESLGVPAMYTATTSLLALLRSGRTTGCVLESGYAATSIVPIYEGNIVNHAVVSVNNLGGWVLTAYLKKLVYERGPDPLGFLSDHAKLEVLCDIKESLCFVSTDFEADLETSNKSSDLEKNFELMDGTVLVLGNELFRCPEILFRPHLCGLEDEDGLAASTTEAITRCSTDDDDGSIPAEMYANIVLSGGNTLFPGFGERLSKEINSILAEAVGISSSTTTAANQSSSEFGVAVEAREDRKSMTWAGGSIVAALPQFQSNSWITKEEYDEFGPSIVHRGLEGNIS